MSRHRLATVLCLALALGAAPLTVSATPAPAPSNQTGADAGYAPGTRAPLLSPQAAGVISGELIALPRPGVDRQAIDTLIAQTNSQIKPQKLELRQAPVRSNRHHAALIATDAAHASQIATALVNSGLFAAVEYNRKQFLPSYRSTPNDPLFNLAAGSDQWGLKSFPGARFNEVWPVMASWGPADSAPVAVIDTACDLTHEDSGPNIRGVWDYGDDDPDVAPDDPQVQDHGTAVASTIAASTDNGAGMAGAAWDNEVLCYKVSEAYDALYLGEAGMSNYAILEAMLDAPIEGAKVINLSLGGHQDSAVFQYVIDELEAQGVVIVAAAGNDALRADPGGVPPNAPTYPAGNDHVLSVGAISSSGVRADFSNYNPLTKVALTAPGESITVATPAWASRYELWDGTSFATPMTAAAAAMVMRARPGLTAAAVRSILTSTSVKLASSGGSDALGYGAGTLDAKAAIDKALTTPTPPWFTPNHGGKDYFYYDSSFTYPLNIGGNPKPTAAVAANSALPSGLRLVNDPDLGWVLTGKVTTPGVYSMVINALVAGKVVATRTITLSICGYGSFDFRGTGLESTTVLEGQNARILSTVFDYSGKPAGWWEVVRTDTGSELAHGAWYAGPLIIKLPVLPVGTYRFKLNLHMVHDLGEQWNGSIPVGPLTVSKKPVVKPSTTPTNGNNKPSTSVTPAKAKAKITVKRQGHKLIVTVKSKGSKATGKVKIKYGVKKLTKGKTVKLKKGKAKFTLPKGRYRVQVKYLGSAKTAKKTLKTKRYKFS